MAYGARLESGFIRKGIAGSNPAPSATPSKYQDCTRFAIGCQNRFLAERPTESYK